MRRRSRSAICPTSPTRRATPPSPGRAASACRATIICSRAPNTTRFRTAYRAYVEQMQTLAGIPDARRQGGPHRRARDRDGQGAMVARAEPRHRGELNDPEMLAGLKAKAPEFDWPLMLKTAGSADIADVMMAQQHRADRDRARSWSRRRSRRGRTMSPFTSSAITRRSCRKAFDDAHVRFLFEDAARRAGRSATAGSAASR